MAVRGLNLDWSYIDVVCTECSASLKRRIFHGGTGEKLTSHFCNNKCKGSWQGNRKPVDKEWLRQKYISEQMSCKAIGKIVERDAKTVLNWLRSFNIETRKRGQNRAVQFQPGHSIRLGVFHTEESKAKMRASTIALGTFPMDNGVPYWTGKTGANHPSWNGGATPERQAFYSSEEWKSARLATYARAKARCERCCVDSKNATMHIHHVIPFAFKETRASLRNLRLLCWECHKWVHSKANGDRDFLPPFGVIRLIKDDPNSEVRINYRPTFQLELPTWLL